PQLDTRRTKHRVIIPYKKRTYTRKMAGNNEDVTALRDQVAKLTADLERLLTTHTPEVERMETKIKEEADRHAKKLQ
ncbi:hypothetical protein, partial [Klebsiella quasipneumoniae]|uniref:hypothetical protein n=1 Tax=Klebsiella quasipneumoniae TaxID=1463165 RepID=UPI0027318403